MKNALSFLFVLFTIVGFSQDNFPLPDSPYTVVYQENFDQHPNGYKFVNEGDTLIKTDSTSIVVNQLWNSTRRAFTGSTLDFDNSAELMFTVGDVSKYDSIRVRLRFANTGDIEYFRKYDVNGNHISDWDMEKDGTPPWTISVFDTVLNTNEFNFNHLKFATALDGSARYHSIQIYGRKDTVKTAIDKIANVVEDFRLYPNPNSGSFNVEFYSNEHFNDVATIYDITGRVVYRQEISASVGQNYLSFNNSLPKGNYILRVKDKTEKVVIYD